MDSGSSPTGQALRPETVQESDLRARLQQAEETIRAIRCGEVDAVVVNGPDGPQVYTLEGADRPYRILVERMHEGSVTLNDHGLILYSNPQFGRLLGRSADSVAGCHFTQFLEEPDSNVFASLVEAAFSRGHSSGEVNLRGEKDAAIPVRVSLTPLEVSGTGNVSVLLSDLREQQRNEAILREERLARLILDQAGECIVVIDPQGVVIRRSESARTLAASPVLLEVFDDVFHLFVSDRPFDSARILESVSGGQRIRGVEATLVLPDGRKAALLVSARPLWSETNQLLGCVITLTDITRQKRAEEALVEQAAELARSNSDLRQFAYSASHDLREPLRQLAIFSQLLEQRFSENLGEEGARLVSHTVESAHRMEKLLDDLMSYIQAADAPQDGPASADANDVVAKVLATFDEQIKQSGASVDCPRLPILAVHEIHLLQLMQNLIGNCLKYRSEDRPVINIAAERSDKGMWRLSVKDNGIGIKPEYQTKVFGLFQRLHGGGKYSGSGIGLAICQKIVSRYGGSIRVESEPGRGSTFSFTLPGAER